MLFTMRVQEWIHRLEEGAGARYLRWILALFGFLMVGVLYDSFCLRDFNNPEAMDAAQLARNLAQGEGFKTDFVRPFSMYLTALHRTDRSPLLKEGHPDIANAPVYPLLLAPLLRFTPDDAELALAKTFTIYGPDLYITLLNQFLLGLGAILVFRLALAWFDRTVAWLSAIVFVLTEIYWRFSISGLSTILLIDLVLFLVWLLVRFERGQREEMGTGKLIALAAAIGATTALAMLTRYAFWALLVPVLGFVLVCAPRRRFVCAAVVLGTCLLVTTPWLARNVALSGWVCGTATFAPLADTGVFPGDRLERSLLPTFKGLPGYRWTLMFGVLNKSVANLREILVTELPRMGGNWLWAFFLAGLLVRFQNPALSRARWFVAGAVALMIPVQALARTHLSAEVPQVNSENLLVVYSPLVLIFGVGLFVVLIESWQAPTPAWHYGALASFVVVVSLPMFLAFAPPRPRAFSPPYYPPRIQQLSQYLGEREMLMSDIPWAVAWYGERQSLWLTLNWRKEFIEVSDFLKTVNGLYVSTRTTDTKFFSNWFAGDNRGWGDFFMHAFLRREVPPAFPLKRSPEGLFANGELFLADRDRWSDRAKNPSKKD